jgi:hypothetical protein
MFVKLSTFHPYLKVRVKKKGMGGIPYMAAPHQLDTYALVS